jgi:hypothetical protein
MANRSQALQQEYDEIMADIQSSENSSLREQGEQAHDRSGEEDVRLTSDNQQQLRLVEFSTIAAQGLPQPTGSANRQQEQRSDVTEYNWEQQLATPIESSGQDQLPPLPLTRTITYQEERTPNVQETLTITVPLQTPDEQGTNETPSGQTRQGQHTPTTINNTTTDQTIDNMHSLPPPPPPRHGIARQRNRPNIMTLTSTPVVMTLNMARKRKIFDHNCEPYPNSSNCRNWHNTTACPICHELPRIGPIYSCPQGHLICQKCSDRVETCPMCRDPVMKTRSLITEYIIFEYMRKDFTACLNQKEGCQIKGTVSELYDHELMCPFTETTCPGKVHGCIWKGARKNLPLHINSQKTCVDILESVDKWMSRSNNKRSERYTNIVRDFEGKEPSIFSRNTDVTWKPILHASNRIYPFWTYLVISRSAMGIWKLGVRGYMSTEMATNFRCRISVTNAQTSGANNGGTDNMVCPTYCGAITSNWTSEQEANDMGRYLTITDHTVDQLRHPTITQKLFNYTVEIKYTSEIENLIKKENEGLPPAPTNFWYAETMV